MKHRIRTAAAAAAVTVSSLVSSAEPAPAYQVDCAILLFLSGGWPTGATLMRKSGMDKAEAGTQCTKIQLASSPATSKKAAARKT